MLKKKAGMILKEGWRGVDTEVWKKIYQKCQKNLRQKPAGGVELRRLIIN